MRPKSHTTHRSVTLKQLRAMLGILFCFLALLLLTVFLRHGDARLQQADTSYRTGEDASTIAGRQAAFNHALELYVTLENDYRPQFGNGKLYYNIGNTYFQLGQYPWSILYYERSQALMPRSETVQQNLALATDKLGLPKKQSISPFAAVFFFHYYLSLPERLQLFFVLSLLTSVLYSIYLWQGHRWVRSLAMALMVLAAVMLLSVGYTRYFSPIKGVIVQSVDLRRDAGLQYAKVEERPVPGGSTVEVLSVLPNGEWLKVMTVSGEMGYIPQEAIRLIGL